MICYELKFNRSFEICGAGVSVFESDDSGTRYLHLHDLRVALTAADPLDFEGRVLAQALTPAPNYHSDKIRTAAITTTIAAAGHHQTEGFGR
jgi:hypothetical protein